MLLEKDKTGFTTVELITVIAVIGIVSAITIPLIVSWVPDIRLKRAAGDLYFRLANTRMNAVKENKVWAIVFDTANNRYFICDDPGADGSWFGAGDTTGTGDNTLGGVLISSDLNTMAYCLDGSRLDAATANCTQRSVGIVLGGGDATTSIPGGAIPGDGVSYTNDFVSFNPQGTGPQGYLYLENKNATTSYAVGNLASGVVRVWKSAEGETGYAQ